MEDAAFSRMVKSTDPEWIEQALTATGTATIRRRRLPAEQVIWLVLGMALFRRWPIDQVVRQLDPAMPNEKGTRVARSAVVQARARLGDEPLEWLSIIERPNGGTRVREDSRGVSSQFIVSMERQFGFRTRLKIANILEVRIPIADRADTRSHGS